MASPLSKHGNTFYLDTHTSCKRLTLQINTDHESPLDMPISIRIDGYTKLRITPRCLNNIYQMYGLHKPITIEGEWMTIPLKCLYVDEIAENIEVINIPGKLPVNKAQLFIGHIIKRKNILNGPTKAYVIMKEDVPVPELFRYKDIDTMQPIEYKDANGMVLAIPLHPTNICDLRHSRMTVMVPEEYTPPTGLVKYTIPSMVSVDFADIDLAKSLIECEDNFNFKIRSFNEASSMFLNASQPITMTLDFIREKTVDVPLDGISIPFSKVFEHVLPNDFTLVNLTSSEDVLLEGKPLTVHLYHMSVSVRRNVVLGRFHKFEERIPFTYCSELGDSNHYFYKGSCSRYFSCPPEQLIQFSGDTSNDSKRYFSEKVKLVMFNTKTPHWNIVGDSDHSDTEEEEEDDDEYTLY